MDPHITPNIPALARGMTCSLCFGGGRVIRDDPERNGQTERFVDTMMHVEAEGFIAICETCVGQLARLFDWIPPVEARSLYRDINILSDERDALIAEVEGLSRRLNAAVELGLTVPDSPADLPLDDETDDDTAEDAEEPIDARVSDTPPASSTTVRRSARKATAK